MYCRVTSKSVATLVLSLALQIGDYKFSGVTNKY